MTHVLRIFRRLLCAVAAMAVLVAPSALPAQEKIHPYTKQTFEKWVGNIEEDIAILAGAKSVEDKIRELENGRRWFQSSHQELVKHPSFEQGMLKMNQLMLGLAELKGKRALEFAEKGLKDMNPNMFSESAGTYQQIKYAEKLIAEFGKGGDTAQAHTAVDNAKAGVEALSGQYNKNKQSGAITVGVQTKGNSYSHQDMLMKHVNF